MAKSEKSGGVAGKSVKTATPAGARAKSSSGLASKTAGSPAPKALSRAVRPGSSSSRMKKSAAAPAAVVQSQLVAPSAVPVADAVGHVHSSRFVTVLPAIPEEDLGLLPSTYEADRIFAVPRDPERVFATWDLSSATRRRVASGNLSIRFTFENGTNVSAVEESVMAGCPQYYCAVPQGMLAVTAELGVRTGSGFECVATSGKVGLAIAFVRSGTPVFARVDQDVPLSSGRSAILPAVTPTSLPAGDSAEVSSDAPAVRNTIGYMPVSGRK